MLKKTIKYTDYNGVEREEDYFFNLSKAEIMEMQMTTNGGMTEMIAALIRSQNIPEITRIFKDIVLKSYGEKSVDGKRFIKVDDNGVPLSRYFSQTEAFSTLYVELASDAGEAAKFINGIIPGDIEISEEEQKKMTEEIMNGNINNVISNMSKQNEEVKQLPQESK